MYPSGALSLTLSKHTVGVFHVHCEISHLPDGAHRRLVAQFVCLLADELRVTRRRLPLCTCFAQAACAISVCVWVPAYARCSLLVHARRLVNGLPAACGRVISRSPGLPTLSLRLDRPVVMSSSSEGCCVSAALLLHAPIGCSHPAIRRIASTADASRSCCWRLLHSSC